MKPKASIRSFLAIAGSSLMAISSAFAQTTLYWDGNNTTANADGGTGTWDTTITNWDTSVAGGAAATWTSGDIAIFGGTAGTVTTGAPITTRGIRFNTTGYSIIADPTNSLSFSNTSNILFNNIAAATITGTVGGSGNVIVSRTNPYTLGALTLNGTSTGGWSGATTVNNGMTLNVAQSNQALLNTSGITLNTGAITLTNTLDAEKTLDRVSDTAGIAVNGGADIRYTNTSAGGRAYAETLGAVTVNSGQLNVLLTTNQAGSQTLTLGSAGSNVSGSGLARTSSTSTVTIGSAGTLNSTTNRVAVYGSTNTTAGEIIGAWATTGNATANNQSDYAIYSGGYIAAAGATLAVTGESGWGSSTTAYQFATAQTLTANREAAALRYTAGNNALALGGNTLKTNGLLNGGNGTLTVSGLGTLTATGTSGGNLFFSGGSITVSSDIKDNGGSVGVVKTGAGTLTLSSTGNDFTGGLVVNAGTVSLGAASSFSGGITLNGGTLSNASADARLGAASNNITVNGNATIGLGNASYARSIELNNGAMLSFSSENFTFTGNVTGTGGLGTNAGFSAGGTFSGLGNTFTGPIVIAGGGTGNNNYRFTFASLADSPTANGNIVFNVNSANGANGSVFEYTGASSLTLNNRAFEINSTGATPSHNAGNTGGGHQIRSNGAGTLTINTDLVVTSPYAQTLVLRGTGAGGGVFAGKISDSANAISGTTALGVAVTAAPVTTITLSSVEGLVVGASISGTGIAGGTTITGINTTTRVVTLSNATTGAIAVNSALTVAGVTNPVSLSKNDSGTWQISGDNSYTGRTNVFAGRLEVTGSGRLGNGNYAGDMSVANTSSGALVFNSSANQILSGVISGNGAFEKNNTGAVTLTNINTYSGNTTVSNGILAVNGTGSINNSAVTINGGNFRYNSSVDYSGTLTFTNGTVSGTNWEGSLGGLMIGAGQTLSPGNSPGTALTTTQTWAGGGSYAWEINDLAGTAGADPGWDLIAGSGALTITATSSSLFNINVISLATSNLAGQLFGFDNTASYAWLIADFDSIAGFSSDAFNIDTTGFQNALNGGFSVVLGDTVSGGDDSQIYLVYNGIPEPSTALLGALGMLVLLRRRR